MSDPCGPNGPEATVAVRFAVIVCHECFKKLDPDMWISENYWININPSIPFDKLPLNNLPLETDEDAAAKWNPTSYA